MHCWYGSGRELEVDNVFEIKRDLGDIYSLSASDLLPVGLRPIELSQRCCKGHIL